MYNAYYCIICLVNKIVKDILINLKLKRFGKKFKFIKQLKFKIIHEPCFL